MSDQRPDAPRRRSTDDGHPAASADELHRVEVELARLSGGVETIAVELRGEVARVRDRQANTDAMVSSLGTRVEANDQRIDTLGRAADERRGGERAWRAVAAGAFALALSALGAVATYLA